MKTIKLLFCISTMLLLSIVSFGQTNKTIEEQTNIPETPNIETDSPIIGSKGMDDAYIGTIVMFAGNFAPVGWEFCEGQLLAISQNPALFSILGTTYGGDGVQTFALPDFRGRVPVGTGTGPGLSPMIRGLMGGVERVTLTQSEMPTHTHSATITLNVSEEANIEDPSGNYIGAPSTPAFSNTSDITLNLSSAIANITQTGQSQSHYNMQPYLGMNFIICVQGLYPPRP